MTQKNAPGLTKDWTAAPKRPWVARNGAKVLIGLSPVVVTVVFLSTVLNAAPPHPAEDAASPGSPVCATTPLAAVVAAQAPWYPEGYVKYSEDIAYKWEMS